MTWAEITAHEDVVDGVAELNRLAAEYLVEADLWKRSPHMNRSLIDTAERLAKIAGIAVDRVLIEPSFADVVDAFVFGGRLQLEHVQSTRRFAYGEPPHVVPRRAGRE